MASVSSTGSIYSSIVAGNKGIGGLASGLDTNAMMDMMTTATRQKIAKQQQNKQLAQWKQTNYRTVATALDAFRQKYLRFGSGGTNTNIASSAFYNSYKASSNNSAVKVTTTNTSSMGDIEIDQVLRLATTNTITGNKNGQQVVSGNKDMVDLKENGAVDFTGHTLSLTVDGTTKNIQLDSLNVASSADYVAELQSLIDDAFGVKSDNNKIVKVRLNDDKGLLFENDTGSVSIAANNALLGLTAGSSNRINTTSTKLRDVASLDGILAGESFKVNINGVELSFTGGDTIESIMAKINNSTANVRMSYSSITGNFEISSKVSGHVNRVEMSDVQGNFLGALFGAAGGGAIASSGFYTNDPLEASGNFSLLSDYNAIKGSASGRTSFLKTLDNLSFTMTVGDTTANVTYNLEEDVRAKIAAGGILTEMEMLDGFNRGIASAFGTSASEGIAFALHGGKVSLTVPDTKKVAITPKTGEVNGLSRLGFTGSGTLDNVIDASDLATAPSLNAFGIGAGTLTINGQTIAYEKTTTLQELFDAINTAGEDGGFTARFASGGLVIDGGDELIISDAADVPGTGFLEKMYGMESSYKSTDAASRATLYGDRDNGGSNAEIMMNGQIISSASNTFTISGTQIEVLAETTEPTKITITSDPEELVTKIKDFIADYNGLVSTINSIIKEKANEDAEYPPLSDEQKEDMTTEEIEKWEIEAKKGILRNDATLNGILTQMRSILYEGVGDSGISLYSIGITTVSYLSGTDRNGHLEITADNEEKLRNAIINNPDGVRELFTKAETGYAAKLDAVFDRAINTSSDPKKRGTLISLAGSTTLSANNSSSLDDKISGYDERISNLRTQLEKEYDRYWKQFSALETAIANMNSQSSWLSSFVAS